MKKRLLLLLSAALLLVASAAAQQVTGTVTDAKTGEVLPFVNVYYSAGNGTQSGIDGTYKVDFHARKLTFSMVGYKPHTVRLKQAQRLDVALEPLEYTQLGEATVTGHKTK